jgi:transcriptional regulator with XRE-family HTH domain
MSVGDRIAIIRKKLGLSQTDLATKSGLKPPTISQYESGSRNPSYEALIKLSGALGVTTDFLIKGEEEEAKVTDTISRITIKIIQGLSEEKRERLLDYAVLLSDKSRIEDVPLFERPTDYANYLLQKYTDSTPPIDIYQLAIRLNIRIMDQELLHEEGILINGTKRVIILNSEIKNRQRRKFTLAILIGHSILPWHLQDTYERNDDHPTLLTENIEEMEAHEFAVSLIMPKFHLEKDLIQNASIGYLKQLAMEKYDVSLFALSNRLVEYDSEKYALLQSKNLTVVQTFSGKRPLVQQVNPNSYAGNFSSNPSEQEEIRSGEVPADYWLIDAYPCERLFEETVYNPKFGKALTLLTMKKRRK